MQDLSQDVVARLERKHWLALAYDHDATEAEAEAEAESERNVREARREEALFRYP